MNKIFSLCLAAAMMFASSAFVSGEELTKEKVKGTVTRIDVAAKSVTIQPKKGDAVTIVFEDADLLDKVKEGGKGQALYVVKDGINVGSKLRKLTAGCQ